MFTPLCSKTEKGKDAGLYLLQFAVFRALAGFLKKNVNFARFFAYIYLKVCLKCSHGDCTLTAPVFGLKYAYLGHFFCDFFGFWPGPFIFFF